MTFGFNSGELGLSSRFPFGKYRGEKVEDVLDEDPQYLEWWAEEVSSPTLSPTVERHVLTVLSDKEYGAEEGDGDNRF